MAMASMAVEAVDVDRRLMARHFHQEPIELLRLKGLVWFVGELIHTVNEPRAIGKCVVENALHPLSTRKFVSIPR